VKRRKEEMVGRGEGRKGRKGGAQEVKGEDRRDGGEGGTGDE